MSRANSALARDRSAVLEEWMTAYGTRVMHLAYFYLKDRHAAEDISQEVFLKAYNSMDDFRGDSQVYTWLYRITVNLCRDRLRSAYHQRTVLPGELPVARSEGDEPESEALKQSKRESIMRSIMSLPEHYREVLVLYYYQELNVVQIAEVTGLAENTVKTRLHRARQQLKQILEHEEEVTS